MARAARASSALKALVLMMHAIRTPVGNSAVYAATVEAMAMLTAIVKLPAGAAPGLFVTTASVSTILATLTHAGKSVGCAITAPAMLDAIAWLLTIAA
jgi:precorrin-4 methylase